MPKSYEVTIELDIDDDDVPSEKNAFPEMSLDEDDDIVIDDPILISSVVFKIPEKVKVIQLSLEIRELIAFHLHLPTGVSAASWAQVADYLDSNYIPHLENDEKYGREMLEQFYNFPAQKLVNAIEKAQRVDILAKLKMIINAGNYIDKNQPSSTMQVDLWRKTTPEEKFSGNNVILVLHYEKTALEKENFRWFLKNLRRNLRLDESVSLTPLDVAKLEKDDGGNVLKKLDDMFPDFPHIIICFSQAYLTALYSTEQDDAFTLRKLIHERTKIEFMNNRMRNKRCRCVVMPDTQMVGTTDWSAVTHHYKFPLDFEDLLRRLLAKKINLKTEVNTL